jgi:hypothetical protein
MPVFQMLVVRVQGLQPLDGATTVNTIVQVTALDAQSVTVTVIG